jgi:TetR/AcrR family transcriptional regulator, tetracycline repressor protein
MQAVADALGVDRKAVSYHVGDRESLLALMASTVFTSEFARVPAPTDGDWRDALAWYAHTIRRALTSLAERLFRLPTPQSWSSSRTPAQATSASP